jgi:prepilin-type N-terminal cleavage/methylation domain-containing protein
MKIYRAKTNAAFTMIEIAISLAIIGIALVAIIGVLPIGMNVQRDNREQTVINQDATIFIEAIRNGARGLDDLTNYVYAITNYQMKFPGGPNVYGFDNSSFLTNGLNIVGLLSTPEFTDLSTGATATNIFVQSYCSNHIVAYVRSMSGPATEKPPQDNQILQENSFGYRLLCVNAALPVDTNSFSLPLDQQTYNRQLAANLHELRLTFMFPLQPNGKLGSGRQTFRTLIAGQLATNSTTGNYLYFYQPQSFTKMP